MKDLSLITPKQRKNLIIITIILGIISLGLTIYEFINFKTAFSFIGIIVEVINFLIIPKVKSEYHRGEQIQKIYENCNETEKDEIYKFIKKYDKDETH